MVHYTGITNETVTATTPSSGTFEYICIFILKAIAPLMHAIDIHIIESLGSVRVVLMFLK